MTTLPADQMAVVLAAVRRADPTLPEPVARKTITTLARWNGQLGRLSSWLSEHPDTLVEPSLDQPQSIDRLTAALLKAGASGPLLPACPDCGRRGVLTRPTTTADRQRRCHRCHRRRSMQDPSHREPCGGCGKLRQVNARAPDGTARCSSCYTRQFQPHHRCDGCGQTRPAACRSNGTTLCASCYRHPKRPCGQCGRTRRVAVKARDGHPDLCPTCHQAPVLTCATCGTTGPCRRTTADRSPICWRCQLVRRLDEVLTGPNGTTPPALLPLRQAILAVDNPRTALGWLGRSPAATLLTSIARGQTPLSHDTLDTAEGRWSVEHLRSLLVATAALPDQDRHLPLLERELHQLAATLDHPEDRALLQSYASWQLLRHCRQTADSGRSLLHSRHNALTRARHTAAFLTDLRAAGRSPQTCRQSDIDAALTRPGSAHLRPFLTWAQHHQHLADITVPPTQKPECPKITSDETVRWQHARRLLSDDTLTTSDRAAGLLLLLYAQTPTRIARLTANNLHSTGTVTRLSIGRDEIVPPEPLADLLRALPDTTPTGMAHTLVDTSKWLFPSRRRPGQHTHPTALSRRLRAIGIDARAERNTALLQLAGEVPSAVLADLLGMHPVTAARWVTTANGDWANYPKTHPASDPFTQYE